MSDQSMNLGTIFTASMSGSFENTVRTLRGLLDSVGTASTQLSNRINSAAQSQTRLAQASDRTVQSIHKTNQAHRESIQHLSASATGWDRLKNAMKITASYGLAGSLIYSVTSALRSGTSEIIKYDQALQNLKAITGATDAEIGIMNTTMLEVAATTRYSANEIADGMVLLGQAGFSAAESINSIRAVSELAGGTLEDLKKTTDLMTTTLRAYNLDAIQSGRVADVMANAMNKSKLTLDSLRIAFNYVGSAAAIMDLSIEETAASMMVLADNGMRASTVGTGLRQVLARMMSPNAQLKKALDDQGISYDKINPKIVGFQNALKTLQVILTDDSGVVNMTKAFDIFQLRGAQAAAVITRAFTDGTWQDAMDSTYNVGSAAEMLAIQSEGLGNKLMNLISLGKNLAISFGRAGITGVLGTLMDALRLVVGGITVFTDNAVGQIILQMAVWTGAIYATGKAVVFLYGILAKSAMVQAISGIGAFISLLWNATKGTEALTLATMAFNAVNWWLVAAAAIAGAGIALYSLSGATEKARQEQEKLAAAATQSVSSLNVYKEALKEAFTSHNSKEFESLLDRLKKDHPELSEAIDRNRDSYNGLTAAMDEVIKTDIDKGISATIAQIGLLNEQVRALSVDYDYRPLGEAFASVEEYASKGASKVKELSAQVANLARQINSQLSPEQRGTPIAEDWLKSHGYNVDEIGPELEKINSLLAEFETKRKAAQAEMFSEKLSKMFTVETTQNYESLYSGLSLLDQAHLTGVIANIDKELEAYRNAADEMEHTTAQRIAAEKTIVAKAVADYEAELHKEEDSEVESSQRKIDIFKRQLTDEDSLNQGRLSKMTDIYNSELALAKKNGDDTVLLTAAYNEAVKELTQKDFEFQKEINNQIVIEERKKSAAVLIERTKNYDIEAAAHQAALERDLQAVELNLAQREISEAKGATQREEINREYFDTALESAQAFTAFLKTNYAGNEDALRKSKQNEAAIVTAATEFAIAEEKRKQAEIVALRNIEVEEQNQPDNQRIQIIQQQIEQEKITEAQGAEAIFQIREQLMLRQVALRKQEADDAKEQYGKQSVEYRKALLDMQQADFELDAAREAHGDKALNALRAEYAEKVKASQEASVAAEKYYTELDQLVRNNEITEAEATRRKSQFNIEALATQENDAKQNYEKLLAAGNSFWDRIKGISKASEKEISDAKENYFRLNQQREQAELAEKERFYGELLQKYNLYLSKKAQATEVAIFNEDARVVLGEQTEEESLKRKATINEAYLSDVATKSREHYEEISKLYPLDAEKRQAAYNKMQDDEIALGQAQLAERERVQAIAVKLYQEEADQKNKINEYQAARSKAALDERLEQIQRSYDDELRAVEIAAQQITGTHEAASKETITVIKDQNGKIIGAYNEFSQKVVDVKNTENNQVKSLYDKHFSDIELAATTHFMAMIKNENARYEEEKTELEKAYTAKAGMTVEKENELKKIKQDHAEKSKKIYEDEINFWKGQLDGIVQRHEKLKNDLLAIKKQMVDEDKAYEQNLFALKIKNLTSLQQYQEKQARFEALMAKQSAEVQMAAEAKTIEEKQKHYEKANEYVSDAKELVNDLSNEVKEGDQVQISGAQAVENATSALNKTHEATTTILKAQETLTEELKKKEEQRYAQVSGRIKQAKEDLEALMKVANEGAVVKIEMHGQDKVDAMLNSLETLSEKNYDKDVYVTVHEKTVQEKRWGGIVDKIKRFAFGGHLSGYGGGDIVDAKLEPGEFVVRKEAVRNIGTNFLYAINNMRIGARDMLSNIKARTGGYISPPRAMNPFPQLAFSGGGAVPKLSSLQNVGSLNLTINEREVGPIYGEIDVLQRLSDQVKQKTRLRSNR